MNATAPREPQKPPERTPMIETSPDAQMSRPVHALVLSAALLVQRTARLRHTDPEDLDALRDLGYFRTEDEIRVSLQTALRARAVEVAAHMTAHGVPTDPAEVRLVPLGVCTSFITVQEARTKGARP